MSYIQMCDTLPTELDVLGMEKANTLALAFRNDDVATLSWQNLSVRVSDRATGKEKLILSDVSGHVKAGKSIHCSTLCN